MKGCIISPAKRAVFERLYSFVYALLCTTVIALGFAAPATADDARQQATDKLFAAVVANDMVEVQLSVAAGADLEYENDRRQRPVDLAADHNYFRIVHYLLGIQNKRRSQASGSRFLSPLTPVPEPVVETPAELMEMSSHAVIAPAPPPSVTSLAAAVQPLLSNGDIVAPDSLSTADPETLPANSLPPFAIAFEATYLQQVNSVFTAAINKQLRTKTSLAAETEPAKHPIQEAQLLDQTADSLPKVVEETSTGTLRSALGLPSGAVTDEGPGVLDQISGKFESNDQMQITETSEAPFKPAVVAPEVQVAEPENAAVKPQQNLEAEPEAPQTAQALVLEVAKLSDPPLPATTAFLIGKSLALGNSETAVEDPSPCIKKPAWKTVICTLPVEWPTGISADFNVLSRLYRGTKTIVHYVSDTATQYHTLFRTESLDAVVEYFRTRYGPPNETLERRTSLYMQPSRLNRTALWRKADAGADGHTVLEIREIDDLRWSMPPDTKNGVIWLHREGAHPIFRYLSASDLLLARIHSRGK